MAFEPKYRSTWTDARGRAVVLDLLKDGYVGAIIPFQLGKEGFKRNDSKNGSAEHVAIRPWLGNINLHPSSRSVLDDVFSDDAAWRMQVTRNSALDLYGQVVKEDRVKSLDLFRNGESIITRCGLGALQDLDFDGTGGLPWFPAYGLHSSKPVLEWIMLILNKLGHQLPVATADNWFAFQMNQAVDPLLQEHVYGAEFINDDGTLQKCFEVLDKLLSRKGAFIHQRDGMLHVYQREQFNQGTFTRRIYPHDYFENGGAVTTDLYTARSTVATPRHLKGGEAPTLPIYSAVEVEYKFDPLKSLVPNSDFSSFGRLPDGFADFAAAAGWDLLHGATVQYSGTEQGPNGETLANRALKMVPAATFQGQVYDLHQLLAVAVNSRAVQNAPTTVFDEGGATLVFKPRAFARFTEYGRSKGPLAYDAYVQVKFASGGTDYFLKYAHGDLKATWTTVSTDKVQVRVTPGYWSEIAIETDPIPGDGVLTVTAYTIVDVRKAPDAPANLEYFMWDDLRIIPVIPGKDTSIGKSRFVTSIGDEPGKTLKLASFEIGTGPTSLHQSAVRNAAGQLLTDWKRGPYAVAEAASGLSGEQLLGRSTLEAVAARREELKLTYWKDVDVSCIRAVADFGKVFLPVSIEEDYYSCQKKIVAPEIRQGAIDATFNVLEDENSGFRSGPKGGEGVVVIADRQDEIAHNEIIAELLENGNRVTALILDYDGMTLDGDAAKSANWDGAYDPVTYGITNPGTTGWGLTRAGDAAFNNVWIRGAVITDSIIDGGDFTIDELLLTGGGVLRGESGEIHVYAEDGTNHGVLVVDTLRILGEIDQVNTNELRVDDQYIVVCQGQTGVPSLNGGMYLERGDQPDVYHEFDEGLDRYGMRFAGGSLMPYARTNQNETISSQYTFTGITAIKGVGADNRIEFYRDSFREAVISVNTDSFTIQQDAGTALYFKYGAAFSTSASISATGAWAFSQKTVFPSIRLTSGAIYRPDDAGVAASFGSGVNALFGTLNLYNTSGSTLLADMSGAGVWTLNNSLNVGGNLLPTTGYTHNIGSDDMKWLSLWVAEFHADIIVADERRITTNGRNTTGYASILTSSLSTAATSYTVKHNEANAGDIVMMEKLGQVEFMKVTSAYSGAGPYTYSVTRNLDGTGANAWEEGDGVFNTGNVGDGFIDQYAKYAITDRVTGNISGPAIAFWERTSNANADYVAGLKLRALIGNLKDKYGYGSTNIYGAAFGDPTAANLTLDPTNGLRIRTGTTILTQVSGGQFKFTNGTLTTLLFDGSQLTGYNASGTNIWGLGTTSYIGPWTFTDQYLNKNNIYIGDNLGELVTGGAGRLLIGNSSAGGVPTVSIRGTNNGSDFVGLLWVDSTRWGLEGYKNGNFVFQLGSTNKIAGWTFDTTSIHKTTGIYTIVQSSTAGDAGKAWYVYNGSAFTFYVQNNGLLYASNATIAGDITATTGELHDLDVLGTLTTGAGGIVTNSTGSFRLQDDGIWLIHGTGSGSSINFTNNYTTSTGRIYSNSSVGITLDDDIEVRVIPGAWIFTFANDGGLEYPNVTAVTNPVSPGNNFIKLYSYNYSLHMVDNAGNRYSFNRTAASDSRLKENVVPMQGVLDKINRLGVYHYDWTSTARQSSMIQSINPEMRQAGILAQEVQAEFPWIVRELGSGYLHWEPRDMVPLLLQSQKEHYAITQSLESRIAALEAAFHATHT